MTEFIALLMYAVVCASGGMMAGFIRTLVQAPEYTLDVIEDITIRLAIASYSTPWSEMVSTWNMGGVTFVAHSLDKKNDDA